MAARDDLSKLDESEPAPESGIDHGIRTRESSEKAHFHVDGRVNKSVAANITIDRDKGVMLVRPRGERRFYGLPLVVVANMVVARVVKDEIGTGIGLGTRRRRS